MMLRVLFVLFFTLLAGISYAETVLVRGGEHEGFTRLVLDLPRKVKWTLETREAVHLKLEGLEAEFDTSAALQKLNSSRVAELSQIKGRPELTIKLNCSCEVKSFYAGNKMLVIDIYGRAKPPADVVKTASVVIAPKTKVENRPKEKPRTRFRGFLHFGFVIGGERRRYEPPCISTLMRLSGPRTSPGASP